ncbi:MAG: DUF2239 family protein [Pseudomonadaceae bacterium]|nr:DUF2239 family protein [Pseudomonadaceae bacterium]
MSPTTSRAAVPELPESVSAFSGQRLIASGSPVDVALTLRTKQQHGALIFNDATGSQLDLNLSGSDAEVSARYAKKAEEESAPPARGRPKLGVVGREVTLLPRHWLWLEQQRGGASAALRRLVEAARKDSEGDDDVRAAQDAANRFLSALVGDQAGFEEATRALYARDREAFIEHTQVLSSDVREYVFRLAAKAMG